MVRLAGSVLGSGRMTENIVWLDFNDAIDPREALVAPEPLVRLGRNDTHICAACQRRPCESTNHPGGYMIGLASVFHGSPDRAA